MGLSAFTLKKKERSFAQKANDELGKGPIKCPEKNEWGRKTVLYAGA